MLKEEAAVECVGTVFDELTGRQLVGTQDRDVGEVGVGGVVLNLENEGWIECGVATAGMTEEKTIRLHGIMGEQQTAGCGSDEEVGAF